MKFQSSFKVIHRIKKLTFVIRKHLCETKILAVHLLQVVFLQSSLNHLSCLVLTGYLKIKR